MPSVSRSAFFGLPMSFFAALPSCLAGEFALVDAISSLYIGYRPSILGAIIGAMLGFVDGYITGVVIAWLYNRLAE